MTTHIHLLELKLVYQLIKYHHKESRGNEGIAPRIPNPGSRYGQALILRLICSASGERTSVPIV